MTEKEIKTEIARLKKEARNIKYFASTLTAVHQLSSRSELLSKSRDFEELAQKYEETLTAKQS